MAETLETIKKYIGPFSGAQMDQIFYEILNYTSERYAKGTANGQAVAAGTIGYNDNSYYYSRQALQSAQAAANAADRAEAAVPAGIDSAVLFTRAQTLTPAQQAQAKKNIGASGTNRNLLDNWRFGSTKINQRGATSFSAQTYGIDRWRGGSVVGGIQITAADLVFAAGTRSVLIQPIRPDYLQAMDGYTLTASLLKSDGTLYTGSRKYTYGSLCTFYSTPGFSIAISAAGNFYIETTSAATQFNVKAVKLEFGEVSTILTDIIPEKWDELDKCLYYAEKVQNGGDGRLILGLGIASSSTTLYFPYVIHPKRTTPSLTVTGSVAYGQTSYTGNATAISIYYIDVNTGHMLMELSGQFSAGQTYRVALNNNASLFFSSDIPA